MRAWCPTGAATTEYLVVDRFSGLAISGFDPIAYFTDGAPLSGRGEFELRHAGAVWRFRNEGNRAAFAADPEIYSPGLAATTPSVSPAVLRFPATRGFGWWPAVGSICSTRPKAKPSSCGIAARLIAAADKQWPIVQRTLSP